MRRFRPFRLLTAIAVIVSISTAAVTLSVGHGTAPTIGAAAGASARSLADPLVRVNAANYTVYCTGLSGSVSFNPALTPSGTGGVTKEAAKVHATLSGCVATPKAGGASVTISSATISGKLKYKTTDFPANVCSIISRRCRCAIQGQSDRHVEFHSCPPIAYERPQGELRGRPAL